MYAILKHGGHQYRVAAGDRLLVDRLTAEVGARVTLEPVLLVADGDSAEVGAGTVASARVIATVVAHRRGRKLRVFTYKPKKRHRRTLGYRSQLTELVIEEVASATSSSKRSAEKPAPAKPAVEAPRRSSRAQPAAAAPKAAAPNAAAPKAAAPKAAAAKAAAAPEASTESALAAEAAAEDEAPKAKRTARTRKKADGT